jgi:sugar phosphate isomerase/epimerase
MADHAPGVPFALSYYIPAVDYTPEGVRFNEPALRARLEAIRVAGITAVGFDGLGPNVTADPPLPVLIPLVRAALDDFGLGLTSLHYAGPTHLAPGQDQGKAQAALVAFVEQFAPWRPGAYVIHAGWAGGCGSDLASQVAAYRAACAASGPDAVLETVAANLRVMARAAAAHGIKLALENVAWFLPLGERHDLPRLVDAVGEPNVGYCLDSGHANAFGESVPDWVRLAGDRLFETHFHDNCGRGQAFAPELQVFPDPAAIDQHLPVGFGTTDWLALIAALVEIGFPGPVTCEAPPWPDEDLARGYAHAVAWWRAAEYIATTGPLPRRTSTPVRK